VRRVLLPILAALALAAAAPVASAQDVPGGAPPEEKTTDPVGDAKKLYAEAKEFRKTSQDTDLGRDERKKARQEAYARFDKAKRILETYLEAHPNEAEIHNETLADINTEMFWLRKEGGVGEFGGMKPKPPVVPPPAAPPAGPDAPPTPEAPPAPKPPGPLDVLAQIQDYEKAHPADVPGLYEMYSKFLADFPNRTMPEYETALKRVEELGQKLKDVYRKTRDDDPDALAGSDPGEVEKLVEQLSLDLKNPDKIVRMRAAKYLGGLGSGKAAPALMEALAAEKEPEVADAVKDALAKIGGRRVCERLAKEKPGTPTAAAVVDVFLRMVRRGGVNSRIAGESVAVFAKSVDLAVQAEIAEALFQAGKDGALGLSLVVDSAPVDRKVGYIEHLGRVGEPRVTGNLARFLTVNPQGARRKQLQAAQDAILLVGKPGVRWLIPALDDPTCQVWTAELLRQITGAKPKDDKRKTWEKWFRENRKAVEGK
jgi:hypothetical protein